MMSKSKLLLVLFLGLAVALSWADFGLRVLTPALQTPHWPDAAYWVAGRVALEGHADLIYGDRAVFYQQAIRLGTIPDIFEANMPTTVLVFMPVAAFSETVARTIWDILMVLCYIASCAILFRALMLPRVAALALWALAPLFHPWLENISWGQAYPLLLLLLVLGVVPGLHNEGRQTDAGSAETETRRKDGERRWSGFVAAAAFGFMAVAKLYYGVVLLLPALVWRRWRVLVGAIALFALAAAVTLVMWGSDLWVRAIGFAVTWRDRPETAVTAYQTLNSLLTHLLRYDATFNRGPVANLPELASLLWWTGAVAMVAATIWVLWACRNNELRITNYALRDPLPADSSTSARLMLGSALMVPVALVLAPAAVDYHFVLSLFPLLVAGKVLWDMYSGGRRSLQSAIGAAAWLVAALLLGAPWRFNVFNVPDVEDWRTVFHYPRLYGALILWALIAGLIVAERRSPAEQSQGISAP
jgi:hypothetical protein